MLFQIFNRVNQALFIAVQLVLLLTIFQSCRSAKSRNNTYDKASTADTTKSYNFVQNFSSKYNILYNANLMLDHEREAIFNSTTKNFQIRQTVFDEPTAEGYEHKLMDSLIQKAYKIVNNKQESKYVNEAYLIIGKANYLKGAYHTSIEFFNNLIRTAEEQKEYLPLAYAWKSRALLQIDKVEQAGLMVDSAFITLDNEKSTRTFVNAAKANLLIRTGHELAAIPYLEYALESNNNLLEKRRWTFLLAQLYKDNGQPEKSMSYFAKIAKSNVPFDMAFEAALQASFIKGKKYAIVDEQVKPLLRMLREGKNDGYQDQILFQIGELYFVKDKEDQAISYYKKSLAEPKRNNYQATETYLKLGDYYFDNRQYILAQHYYDSVANVLPVDYTDVNKVRRKLAYMGEITKLYEEITKNDTLLRLSSLSLEEQTKVVEKYASRQLEEKKAQIAAEIKAASKGKKSKRETSNADLNNNAVFASMNQQSTSPIAGSDRTFYFNNPDELLLGQSSFRRKWGGRKSKDNWRYEVDKIGEIGNSTQVATVVQAKEIKVDVLDEDAYTSQIKENYLKAIPKTIKERDSISLVNHDNFIVLGNIYRDYTQISTEAIKVYEDFLKRYPNTPAGAEIYYSLYRMYEGIDKSKSLSYKNKLIAMYPGTLHARVAEDPAYMDKYRRDKNILDRLFERLFGLYASGEHVAVIQEADRELQGRFENTGLVAQVEYLRALAVGRVGRVEDFTSNLAKIIQKYPQDSLVTPLAKDNIAFIEKNPDLFVNRVNALQDIDKSRVAFVDEPNMTPWPLLDIVGDYRTGVALAVVPSKPVIEQKIKTKIEAEKPKEVQKEKIVTDIVKGDIIKEVDMKAIVKEREKEEVVAVVNKKEEKMKVGELLGVKGDANVNANQQANVNANVVLGDREIKAVNIDFGPNEYRDKKLFPDTADYFFTINVGDAKINMAPSRYGIGQFNRTRYANLAINHQLKVVNGENQLIFIGPFKSFEAVHAYEARILPLMPEIMKVPNEIYNTFVITKEVIPSLTDGVSIKNYHQNYIEQ